VSLRMINIARTALSAQRAALEVIGHNTANAQTEGYLRQEPVHVAIPGHVPGAGGGGVELSDIRLLRDELLMAQVRHERGDLGRERSLRAALVQVEGLFTDVSQGGLALRIEEMFDAWADLGLDPAGAACRAQVIERSELAAETIAERYQGLADLRVEIDQRLGDLVGRVNALAQEVAALNRQVGSVPEPGGRNDLITRRDALVDELAELSGAEIIPQEDGVVDVLVGGIRLVEHDRVNAFELIDDPAQPGLHLVSLGGQAPPQGLRGEMAGRLQARDELIPAYQAQLDTLAQTLADQVNAQHSAGLDLSGNPAGDFFEYDPTRPAASLRVRAEIIADGSLIAAAQSAIVETDGTNALAIDDLRNSRLLSGGIATLSEYCGELIAGVGIDAEAAQTRLDSRELLLGNLQAELSHQSGVSLDEEALELIRYQQAYTAASRLMSVALEMMDLIVQLK